MKPLPENGPPSDGIPLASVPSRIARFYQVNDVTKFSLDRPLHKGTIDKENEFKVVEKNIDDLIANELAIILKSLFVDTVVRKNDDDDKQQFAGNIAMVRGCAQRRRRNTTRSICVRNDGNGQRRIETVDRVIQSGSETKYSSFDHAVAGLLTRVLRHCS